MIISLYAGGMTVRNIEHHLVSTVGVEISRETIIVKVRDGAHVRNTADHIAVGVDMDGIKHVLGIWIQASDGAKFWAGVCAQLANRGIRDVLIVCCDGLTGFPEAIEATWP
jgi:transposase, mutator family